MNPADVRYEASWLVQALGFTANPLRRGVDRLTASVVVALLLAAMLAVPLAATFGSVMHEQESQRAAQEAAGRQQVTAVLTENARFEVIGGDPRGQYTTTKAVVQWRDQRNQPHSASIEAPAGSARGSTTPVWVDQAGHLTSSPRSEQSVAAGAVFAAIWFLIVVEVVCLVLIACVRRLATRYAATVWEREWEVVERRWMRPQP